MKIKMLRLFEDCIDMSEPESNGWIIISNLVSSFSRVDAPITANSINWFLRSLKPESMVAFGLKTLWHGLQHAIRSSIYLEQKEKTVKSRLDLLIDGDFPVSYAMAIAHWTALLAIGKKLLPMLLIAGSVLHVEGYDYDLESPIDPTVMAKQLPFLYDAWCNALTSSLETVNEVMKSELDLALEEAGRSEDILRELKMIAGERRNTKEENIQKQCSICHDDYTILGLGLVEPRWAAFVECTSSKHRYNVRCQEVKTHEVINPDGASDSDEDAFHDAESDLPDTGPEGASDETAPEDWIIECENFIREVDKRKGKDPFRAVAAHLYRTQARVWLGNYEAGELFCGTCSLKSQGYIDEKMNETDFFSSMPKSFNS
jgi:hypothetical protein